MPELTAESLVRQTCRLGDRGGAGDFSCHSYLRVFVGSRRQQPVLLEEPVFLYQSAEGVKQADQVEALPDHGEGSPEPPGGKSER